MVGNLNVNRMGTRTRAIWVLVFVATVALLAVMAMASTDTEAQETKDITLYLHNTTVSKDIGDVVTFRVINTTRGTTGLAITEPTILATHQDWYLYPALADDVTINGRISMYIWALRSVRMGDSTQATMIYELYDVDDTGAKVSRIARGITNVDMPNYWKQYTVSNISVANYTVPNGHFLLLEYELQGSSSNNYQVAWGDFNYRSKIVIECQDYLLVDEVQVIDQAGLTAYVLDMDVEDKDVSFTADVTDPFGGYDVRGANATLVGPGGRVYIDDVGMTRTAGYFTSYVTSFGLSWNYSGYPSGMYNLTVSSFDNTGHYYRFPAHPDSEIYGGHLENLTIAFWLGGPPHNVTVTVLDNMTRPLEGAVVTIHDRSEVTDPVGNASIWIANATYDLWVHWQDVQVYAGTVNVSGDTAIVVEVAVYDPAFHLVDDVGDPVDNAVALVEHPNGTALAEFGRTDGNGDFALDRMAGGDYHLTLFWLGAVVFDEDITIDGNGPFELAAYVFVLDVRVEDEFGSGIGLAQVVIVETTSQIVLDSSLTDLDGNMSTRLPLGYYDFTVYWRNSLIHDSTKGYYLNASGSIVLLADIFTIDITVTDTAGLPLEGAKVVVGSADGTQILDLLVTDREGATSTRLPPGDYTIWTYWRDILVDMISPYSISDHQDLNIGGEVYWVPVVVQDSIGEPLVSASVGIAHSSGQPFGTRVTDPEGTLTIRLPAGTYTIDVTWSDVPVLSTTALIDSDDLLVLETAVYYLEVVVVDAANIDLEGALVTTTVDLTSRIAGEERTDDGGRVTFRLPAGTILLDVSWKDSPVYSGFVDVDDNMEVTLTVAVYDATFKTADSQEAPVAAAILTVTNATTGRLMGTAVTDATGEAALRLPLGVYDLVVIWQGHVVFEGVATVDSLGTHVLACTVHYLTLRLVDADGVDLENAHVTVEAAGGEGTIGTLRTDATGSVTYRLPAGDWIVHATWKNVGVLATTHVLTGDETVQMVASVHRPVVHLVDTGDLDLANAEVTLALAGTGTVLATGITDGSGVVAFRLPGADYTVTARWQDTGVLEAPITVDGNSPYILMASVHQLTFYVEDDAGIDLEGATVSVTNGTTGLVLGTGFTDASGMLTLRLPEGPADVEVWWRATLVHAESGISLEEGVEFQVLATVHYLTVKVVGSDGASVPGADVNVEAGGEAIASGRTDPKGTVEFRLPGGQYTVRIALTTTQQMTAIEVDRSEDLALNETMTLQFDLTGEEYPIPMYRTNLFLVIILFVVTVVVLMFLMRTLVSRERANALSHVEEERPSDTVDLLDLEVEEELAVDGSRDPLDDLVDEAEIDLEDKH